MWSILLVPINKVKIYQSLKYVDDFPRNVYFIFIFYLVGLVVGVDVISLELKEVVGGSMVCPVLRYLIGT